MRPSLLLLPLLLLLTGCGTTPADTAATGGSATAGPDSLAAAGSGRLTVEVDPGDGSPPQTWTLTCNGAGEGTHPRAEAACAHLQSMDAPFAPLPDDVMCTEIYGGPQTARISGRWQGQPVDLALSRSNGCLTSQWDGLVPVVPAVS
jgi:hypothetical protein